MAKEYAVENSTPGMVAAFLSYSRRHKSKRASVGIILVRNGRIFEKAIEIPFDSISCTLDATASAAVVAMGMLLPGESVVFYTRDFVFRRAVNDKRWQKWMLNDWKNQKGQAIRSKPMWELLIKAMVGREVRCGRIPAIDQSMISHVHRMKVVSSIPIFTREDYESVYDINVLHGKNPTFFVPDSP